ncbi:peptide chain release factor N(5)-glutamine methyltransferase [Thalassotalea ganghwensis]
MVNSTIEQAIKQGEQQLALLSDSAKLDSQLLLSSVLGCERSYLLTWPEQKLKVEQYQDYLKLLKRRTSGEPIAYILGVKEFWSLLLKVAPSTLIPRPDTEVLVEAILDHHDQAAKTVCDLGTGTGAIALALAVERAYWQIDAIDFQSEAVALAIENAKTLNINNINVYQSDWFANVMPSKRFDIIVSNPPYIDGNDHHLNEGDVRFEPKSALVADDNGFADFRQIIEQAKHYLNHHGMLYFEHGFEQAEALRTLLTENGFIEAQTRQDYNGLDRITFAKYLSN